MALIKCTECGKQISEYAESCPNCGCPMVKIKEDTELNRLKETDLCEYSKIAAKKAIEDSIHDTVRRYVNDDTPTLPTDFFLYTNPIP